MKYNPPFGSPDPNAGYVDRNTAAGASGSRVPAAAIEHPQREIAAVIAAAGLEPSGSDLTQLLQAIQSLIAQSTGEGGDSNFVLMTEARTRLRIFPEVLTSDGRLPVTSPATGQVRIPAGYDFLHRGIFNVTTVQSDFATAPSKTYHLRWNKAGGFAMKDLGDVAYNPSALPEDAPNFDSTFDDMLIARVATNASNVATITNLANKDRLFLNVGVVGTSEGNAGKNLARFGFLQPINWARTPIGKNYNVVSMSNVGQSTDGDVILYGVYPSVATTLPASRYQSKFSLMYDFAEELTLALDLRA